MIWSKESDSCMNSCCSLIMSGMFQMLAAHEWLLLLQALLQHKACAFGDLWLPKP
jgi:hypothetical protein